METKQMTVLEVLEITVRDLGGINIPVGMIQQVGMPIGQAIGNLNECIRALREAEQAEQQEAQGDELPDNVIDLGEIDADADDAEPVTD